MIFLIIPLKKKKINLNYIVVVKYGIIGNITEI